MAQAHLVTPCRSLSLSSALCGAPERWATGRGINSIKHLRNAWKFANPDLPKSEVGMNERLCAKTLAFLPHLATAASNPTQGRTHLPTGAPGRTPQGLPPPPPPPPSSPPSVVARCRPCCAGSGREVRGGKWGEEYEWKAGVKCGVWTWVKVWNRV